MAKKQVKTDEPIALDVQLSKGEAFIEKNWKVLVGVLAAVIVIVAGVYVYRLVMEGKEADAQKAVAAAQDSFEKEQWETALNGDGNTMGFIKVIDEFGGTKTANLAKLYAGLSYAKLGKTDEAIKYLEDYDTQDDEIVSPSAIAALGNLYVTAGDQEKGAKTLVKAAEKADNDAVSPVFLMQAGEVYEQMGQAEKALELYKRVKDDYADSRAAQDIDPIIERVSAN